MRHNILISSIHGSSRSEYYHYLEDNLNLTSSNVYGFDWSEKKIEKCIKNISEDEPYRTHFHTQFDSNNITGMSKTLFNFTSNKLYKEKWYDFILLFKRAAQHSNKPNNFDAEKIIEVFKYIPFDSTIHNNSYNHFYEIIYNMVIKFDAVFIAPSGMTNLPLWLIDPDYSDIEVRNNQIFELYKLSEFHKKYNLKDSDFRWRNKEIIRSISNEYNSSAITDLFNTLIDLFILDICYKKNIPVYGSCQGAHIMWLYLGGKMTKFNKYNIAGLKQEICDINITGVGDSINDYGIDCEEEYNLSKTDKSHPNHDILSRLGKIKTYTDYQHATIMVDNISIPGKEINTLCEHKLKLDYSKQQNLVQNNIVNDAANQIFPRLVSAFQHRNFIGTQSHPFKHGSDTRPEAQHLRKNTRNFIQAALGLDRVKGYYL